MVAIRDVKLWHRRHVLHVSEMSVGPGQRIGVIAPKGAGKTCLMKAIVGVKRPIEGYVRLLGSDPFVDSEGFLRVGYVPQARVPWGFMNVAQVAWFERQLYPTWRTEPVESLLGRLSLPATAATRKLSLHESRLLALAMALAHEPELLVVDSCPLVLTDDRVQDRLAGAFCRGTSLVFACQDMDLASTLRADMIYEIAGQQLLLRA